ncbi:hypothetical protein A9G29_08190 [Gilliamella sp. Fer2-1]|jgi:hypothetical protein|nr:hypothetical protein A9G29_08190 [Gilliamella apicola]
MKNITLWLEKVERFLIDHGGSELYYLLKAMCEAKKINFLDLISDASKGLGETVSEDIAYMLDQDLDDPKKFEGAIFIFGDSEGFPMPIELFISLIHKVSEAYIEAHPKDKDSIEFYMNKLRERYSK